jgi:hypothetical protein
MTCAMSSGWPILWVSSGRISVTVRVIALSLSMPHSSAAWSPKPPGRSYSGVRVGPGTTTFEDLGLVVLGERAHLGIPAAFHDVLVDLVAFAHPPAQVGWPPCRLASLIARSSATQHWTRP